MLPAPSDLFEDRTTMAGHWFGRTCVIALSLGSALATGCETMRENRNAVSGAGAGGLIGAGIGTVVGAATGDPGAGAAVGAALGAGTGAALGAEADYEERERKDAVRLAEAEAALATGPNGTVGITDVIQMANSQPPVSDDVIISYIRKNGGAFNLSPSDMEYLKKNNVSDRVVMEMLNSRPPSRVAVRPAPRTVVIRDPFPPPPVVVYERPYYWGPRPWYYVPHRHHHHHAPSVGFGVTIRR